MPNVAVAPATLSTNPAILPFGGVAKPAKAPASVAYTPTYYTPVPIGTVLGCGTVGAAYSETIVGSGGTSAYTFAITSGSIPSGVTLNSSTGVISGTPTAAGTYNFTITVTDANAYTGSHSFTIAVANPSGGGNFGSIN